MKYFRMYIYEITPSGAQKGNAALGYLDFDETDFTRLDRLDKGFSSALLSELESCLQTARCDD